MYVDTSPLSPVRCAQVPFVFDQPSWEGDPPDDVFTSQEEALATAIGQLWANFAAGGNPNGGGGRGGGGGRSGGGGGGGGGDTGGGGGGGGGWPVYTNATDLEYVLTANETLFSQPSFRRAACTFWESIYALRSK